MLRVEHPLSLCAAGFAEFHAVDRCNQEVKETAAAKDMAEKCPPPDLSADPTALMVKPQPTLSINISNHFHFNIQEFIFQSLDKIDEDRYDSEAKVTKADKAVIFVLDIIDHIFLHLSHLSSSAAQENSKQ